MGLTATNYDTVNSHWVNCKISNAAGQPWGLGITANVGIGTTTVNLLSSANSPGMPIDQWGNPFHYLPAGYTVVCTYTTAVSAGSYIGIDAQAGEF